MNTFVEIKVVSADKLKAQKAINLAFDKIKEIEYLMNKFDSNSELSKLNTSSKNKPIEISDELFYCIKSSLEFSKLTDGAFDITIEPLVKLWREVGDRQVFPSDAEIKGALSDIGYSNIKLDTKNQSIVFSNSEIKIDLGGIAKGYAVDEAIEVLKREEISQALVNIGGNIYCLGESDRSEYWNLGLQDPAAKDKIIGTIKLKDKATSTSGSYERFFLIKEKSFSHIINPKTGLPSEDLLSVTVIANSAIEADALSTAIFVLGKEKGAELIKRLKSIEAIIISPGREEGELDIWVSSGIEDKVEISKGNYNRLW